MTKIYTTDKLVPYKNSGSLLKEPSVRKSNMYLESRKSINGFVGCGHGCVYCKPSFQRQMKRQKCPLCRTFTPHYHLSRLGKRPPKTEEGEFIFFPSSGDLAFANSSFVLLHIAYAKGYPDRTFLIQSKSPDFFKDYTFPDNVILGTTIETNLLVFSTPSEYKYYSEISQAPYPCNRIQWMEQLCHKRKSVTIEPILDFTLSVMVEWMERIRPEIIWVGYDNHNCRLPEPKLEKTMLLVTELRKRGFDVRTKTLRKAWYEEDENMIEEKGVLRDLLLHEPFCRKSFTKNQLELIRLLKEGFELHRDMTFSGEWSLHNPNGEGLGTHVNVSSAVKLWRLGVLKIISNEFPTEKYAIKDECK